MTMGPITPLADQELDARLATPLASLDLPTRLVNFLRRRELGLVSDFVRLAPEELLLEKNLGRRSIADARAAILTTVGVSWEDARRHILAREGGAVPAGPDAPVEVTGGDPEVERWKRYRVRLAGVKRTPLADLELPTRMANVAKQEGITTLGGLLGLSWREVSTAKNVGRGTIAATLAVLDAAVERLGSASPGAEDGSEEGGRLPRRAIVLELRDGVRWLTLLVEALRTLDGRERMIATQRAGLAGPVPTLDELGEVFGCSRERIRQLEAVAIGRLRSTLPSKAIAERLAAACHVLVESAEAVAARDPLLALDGEHEGEPFAFLVNEILEGDLAAFVLEERLVLSRAKKSVLQALVARVQVLLEAASFPVEEDALAHDVAVALDIGVVDAKALFGFTGESLKREGSRILGFGRWRGADVLALLRAASGPVPKAEVEAMFGRGKLPDEVILVDHGLFSLAEKFEGWERWQRRLPGLVRKILVEQGPDRQWSTYELLELLATACELPEWMTPSMLGSLLRRSTEIEYLGRNVVALPRSTRAAEGEQERVQIVPKLLEILTAYGRPMPAVEARRALEEVRGLSEHTWNLYSQRPPVLALDGGLLGLFPRDLPDGADRGRERAERLMHALYEALAAGQKGLGVHEVDPFLTELGGLAEGYTPRLLRSVARQDGRFRLNQGGAIGLAEWESVRVPTQREILEELLSLGGGETPLEQVRKRLRTRDGEPLTRPQLWNLAVSVGARLVGERMVRRTEGAEPGRSRLVADVLEALPERTAAVFEQLFDSALQAPATAGDDLAAELAAWESTLRSHAETDAQHIELDQVAAIASAARGLLQKRDALSGELRALAEAAVRYVICTDDADTDLSVGGLDDDEAVVARVAAALGAPEPLAAQEDSART